MTCSMVKDPALNQPLTNGALERGLKPLRRRRDSRATEHSERPDGLPMADKSKMETLAATVVVPPSVPSI